jgi:hypothetical protein
MKYRSEFPRAARARVEAATLRAYDALEQNVRGMEPWRRVDPFIRCVLQVFIAFVREGYEFGKKSNHRAWTDRELEQRCRDFLLWTVVEAWEDKAKDLGIRKMFSSGGWGYSISDDDRRRIEKSPEWKQYQELLLEAFDASARAADCRLPQPEKAGGTAPKTDQSIETEPSGDEPSSTEAGPAMNDATDETDRRKAVDNLHRRSIQPDGESNHPNRHLEITSLQVSRRV